MEVQRRYQRARTVTFAVTFVLLDALPEEDRALWATAFYADLRRGELRGLQDDDIDLEANLIRVRRGWDDVEGAIEPKSPRWQSRWWRCSIRSDRSGGFTLAREH